MCGYVRACNANFGPQWLMTAASIFRYSLCVIGKYDTPADYRDSLPLQSGRVSGADTRAPTKPSIIEISLTRMSRSPSLASPLTLTADHLYAPRTGPIRITPD